MNLGALLDAWLSVGVLYIAADVTFFRGVSPAYGDALSAANWTLKSGV